MGKPMHSMDRQGRPLLPEDWYKQNRLLFCLPNLPSGPLSFQWKELPEEYTATHRLLLTWLAMNRYWNMVQSEAPFALSDALSVCEKINEFEKEDSSLVPGILSPWNRHGNNAWNYLPCSYPLTIQELFALLTPKPRFPWQERTGVYRHDKIHVPPPPPRGEMVPLKKVRG